jgi:hypothetical protein
MTNKSAPGASASKPHGDASKLISTWRLVDHLQELVETGEKQYPRGRDPKGFLTYTADGRFHVLNVPGERRRPKGVSPTDEEALALFKGLTAYAGRYSVADGKVIHHVEISWNESWTGTDQERRFTLDGDRLTIVNGPIFSPWDGKRIIATMTYERVARGG